MTDNVRAIRGGDTEKVTINLGFVDLGRIDLLVQEGFYSNRTDFIRTAIRGQLAQPELQHLPLDGARHLGGVGRELAADRGADEVGPVE